MGETFKIMVKGVNKDIPAVALADRWIYDSENIATVATQQEFFRTTAAKNLNQANFEGDYTLVPEGHVFQTMAHLLRVQKDGAAAANAFLTNVDAQELFEQGYVDWKIQGATQEEICGYYLAGGYDWSIQYQPGNLGAGDAVRAADGSRQNVREYRITKDIPGGRSLKYFMYWPGGVTLGTTRRLVVSLYGIEGMLV